MKNTSSVLTKKIEYDIPFVPSAEERLATILKFADVKEGQFAADLGAGDGRVVIALARAGAYAFGFEIDPKRSTLAYTNIIKAGYKDRAYIYNLNFWDVDLRAFDIITVFGISSIMERLEAKVKSELRAGTKIISNLFPFPNWKETKFKENVYLYIR